MKKYEINNNMCYAISGQLAIDTEGEPIFAACEDAETILEVLGMDEDEAVDLIEKNGEDVDPEYINSTSIQDWAAEWSN